MRDHPSTLARLEHQTHQPHRRLPAVLDVTDDEALVELTAPTVRPGTLEEEEALARIDAARDEERAQLSETREERARKWRRQQARQVNHYRGTRT